MCYVLCLLSGCRPDSCPTGGRRATRASDGFHKPILLRVHNCDGETAESEQDQVAAVSEAVQGETESELLTS